ncbi:uncharacterized protein LOC116210381 [Punica granatum]|uniref:Uncharacterized protein LOC116210381 n=1 Tax=Punica granatum TaxID=22663 RepID=A0A6P8E548_PUNGR|nr:uncharacterized protein LOC116210381 [Punica granatum]
MESPNSLPLFPIVCYWYSFFSSVAFMYCPQTARSNAIYSHLVLESDIRSNFTPNQNNSHTGKNQFHILAKLESTPPLSLSLLAIRMVAQNLAMIFASVDAEPQVFS